MNRRFRTALAAAAGATVLGVVAIAPPASAATAVVQFSKIQYDSPGTDTRSNTSLVNEYVRLINRSSFTVNLGRWKLKDAAGHTYTFPSHSLGAGKTVYIHTGKGTNGKPDSAHLYWNSGNYVWNNDKDTATIQSATGRKYDTCSWTKTGSGVTSC